MAIVQIVTKFMLPILMNYLPQEELLPRLSGLAVAAGTSAAVSGSGTSDEERRERWEKGVVDYTGDDRSDPLLVPYSLTK